MSELKITQQNLKEILDANSDMQIDFVSLQIIPFIDCFCK